MEPVVLITRKNVNCSTITKEQFVTMMMEDLKNSVIKSEEIFRPELEERFYYNKEQHKKYVEKRAREFATKKWKTDKKREQYVHDELAKIDKNQYIFHPVSYFDFKLEPFSNSISDNCILQVNTTEEKLGSCFDEIHNNKYFINAIGWELVEIRNARSQIKLIMPEEINEMYRKEEESLYNTISSFYDGSNYCGD